MKARAVIFLLLIVERYAGHELSDRVREQMRNNFSRPGENIHLFYQYQSLANTVRDTRTSWWRILWVVMHD